MHPGEEECALGIGSTWAIRVKSVAHSGLQMALHLHRRVDTARINRPWPVSLGATAKSRRQWLVSLWLPSMRRLTSNCLEPSN